MRSEKARPSRLAEACLSILGKADLGDVTPSVTQSEKGTWIELKRFEAFFRLYVADDLRCSVRLNAKGETSRRDNFHLYSPAKTGMSVEEITAEIEAKVGLTKTLEAIARVRRSWDGSGNSGEHEAWLRLWIDRWCREAGQPSPRSEPAEQVRRLSMTVDVDTYETLRRYAFYARTTPNKAAAKIVEGHMARWRERSTAGPAANGQEDS